MHKNRTLKTLEKQPTILLKDACAVFREAAARADPDGKPVMAESVIAATVSTVRQTLITRLREAESDANAVPSASTPAALDQAIADVDLRPLMPILAAEAKRTARVRGYKDPSNAGRLAERFVRLVTGVDFSGPVVASRETYVTDGWRQLLAAAPEAYSHYEKHAGVVHEVTRVASICAKHGVLCPTELPEWHVLDDWLKGAGHNHVRRSKAFSFLRHLAEVARRMDPKFLVRIYDRRRTSSARNLAADPRARELISDPLPSNATPFELFLFILQRIAPELATFVQMYVDGPGKSLRAATNEQRIATLDRAVASLVRLGYADMLRTMVPTDFFTDRVSADRLRLAPQAVKLDGFSATALERLGIAGSSTTLPLIALALDEQAESAWRNSPRHRRAPEDAVQYVRTLVDGCEALWYMIVAVLEPTLAASNPELLARCHVGRKAALDHLRSAPGGQPHDVPVKNKSVLISLITLPQLVCVGLPVLGQHARACRDAWRRLGEQARAKGSSRTHDLERRARAEYLEWLDRYTALAAFVADPMRMKNIEFARVGDGCEVRVDASIVAGQLCVTGVRSVFYRNSQANSYAELKYPGSSSRDREESRIWDWHPDLIDFELLGEFLSELWFPRHEGSPAGAGNDVAHAVAVLARLRGDGDSRCALFATTRATTHPWNGMGRGPLNTRFGRALHWVCREVLGRPLPDWDDLGAEYFALFAPHVVRTLWASYWLGVRNQHTIECPAASFGSTVSAAGKRQSISATAFAELATNDTAKMLREEYEATTSSMKARMRQHAPGHWEHPATYDQWMDALPWIACRLSPGSDPTVPVPERVQQARIATAQSDGRLQPPRLRRSRTAATTSG